MSTAYTARGKPICEPGEDEESLRYGTPIGPFMETLALLIDGLQAGQLGKTPGRKKARKTVPTKKRASRVSKR